MVLNLEQKTLKCVPVCITFVLVLIPSSDSLVHYCANTITILLNLRATNNQLIIGLMPQLD